LPAPGYAQLAERRFEFIPTNSSDEPPLKGPSDVGTGQEDRRIRLSELIDILNERFGDSFVRRFQECDGGWSPLHLIPRIPEVGKPKKPGRGTPLPFCEFLKLGRPEKPFLMDFEPAFWRFVFAPALADLRACRQHVDRCRGMLVHHADEEIDLLLRRWRTADRGEGRAVLLSGEPGIGKSHIAAALNELLADEPHITLNYACSSHHQNSALFPFIGQLERAAGFERVDSPAARLSKLKASVVDRSDAVIAHLANLLSLPPDPHYQLPEMSPQKRKEETLVAFSNQLDHLAARRPVLIIFEDIHWIDPTSLELLVRTVERLPGLRALLLMTARPEFAPPWPGHAHVSTLPLTRLSRRDGAALVERVTGGKALPDEVMTQILTRTDGVPLFVEELTKAIIESGQLEERSGQYVLGHSLPSLAIPATLHASLLARLDRLASVRDVAQIAAVIGREFSYELLNSVGGLPRNKIDEALEQLVQSELIFRRGTVPQAVYTFKHALMRDAAYAGLLKSRRAQIHAALGDAFEQVGQNGDPRKAQEVLQIQPFWQVNAGRYVIMGMVSSLIGLPVFEPDTLAEERPEWERLRRAHLAEIGGAFGDLKPDQRVLLFCHDPTALPFLAEEPAIQAKLAQSICTALRCGCRGQSAG
jgi:energy-coupling factor transporter ATP-binding protein EcfA2